MKLKLLSAAALSLALMGGAALAQNTSSTSGGDTNTESDAVFLGNKEKMAMFYSDDSMATLRTDDEIRAAWTAMSADDQTAMRGACETLTKGGGGEGSAASASPSNAELCGKINAF